jgi:DNA replication and repair protein RecF
MALIRLDITNFRNLRSLHIEPLPRGFNLIFGDNGSGKTSLLEAIYFLSMGRSFRSSLASRVVCHDADKFSLFAQLTIGQQTMPVGLERNEKGETKIRIAGQNASGIAELAHILPIQLINADSYHLLEGPAFRRKYLDWGAFYSAPSFFRVWKQFQRALKQRNAALRNHLPPKEINIWTDEVAENGIQLDNLRREYVDHLLPLLTHTVSELLHIDGLQIAYEPGWDQRKNYQEILAESIIKDRQAGFTQMGPHRADFKVLIDGIPAKDILSRGQQKLFVCAMIITQGTLLYKHTKKQPIYLVDDLPAELDSVSRSNLLSLLSKQDAQLFITAVERQTLEGFISPHPSKMFHVEHGEVGELKKESATRSIELSV